MRALFPFLRLFSHAKFSLCLGLVLMIFGLASSIGLLNVSGWFLAATAIAGFGTLFNFFYPSASVRGLAIGRTAVRYFEKLVTHDATFRLLAKLRVQVFRKIIPLSPAVLNRYRNSDLLNRLVADVDTLDSLYLRLIAPFSSAIIVIVAMTIGLSFIHVSLAWTLGLCLLVLVLAIPTLFYQLGKKFGANLTQSRMRYRTQFLEFIEAQAELLLFNAEINARQGMVKTEQNWQQYQQKEADLSALSTAILLFCNGVLVCALLWFSAEADFGSDDYRAAFIALFAFAALASFEILMPLGAAFLHIGQVIASAERITEITQQTPIVIFDGEVSLEHNENPLIQADHLCFTYPGQQNVTLTDFNLAIRRGEKIAFLGKTGSGKSTFLQLLVRNYDPSRGELKIAGKPVHVYEESTLRRQICFLTQRIHVFSDTLRNNLQLASAVKIDDKKMYDVLNQVGLIGLTEQEAGLDLWLGDGGRPLSGGEQRRLGLARVLLSEAPILLLDEPTEGLDRETERRILSLVFAHSQNKTLVMVTHRLTEIERFNRLVLIDEGKLIEQGSYPELIEKEGYFKRLIGRL